jgi:hypothetical protein
MSSSLPVLKIKVDERVVYGISLVLWLGALASYIIAFINYNKTTASPTTVNPNKTFNFFIALGSILVWLQIFTILALVGTPDLFTKYSS